MAAVAPHLERFGRELKCPICLSLFQQAAVLSCTHCFCKPCILTSLKGMPFCPVCKVPATRREVRPSPKMDNVVGIYRDIEAAVGITPFASQDPNTHGFHKQTKGGDNSPERGNATKRIPSKKRVQAPQMASSGNVKDKEKSRKKKRKAQVEEEEEDLNPVSLNDFENFEAELAKEKAWEFGRCEAASSSKLQKTAEHNTAQRELPRQSTPLAPFFWLSSQDDPQITQTHPSPDIAANRPSFSDLKSSEHHSSEQDMEDVSKGHGADSDPFLWTQRACSPELEGNAHDDMMNLIVEDSQELDPYLPIKQFLEGDTDSGKSVIRRARVDPVKVEVPFDKIPWTEKPHAPVSEGPPKEGDVKPVRSPAKKRNNRISKSPVRQAGNGTVQEREVSPRKSGEAVCAFCQRAGDCSVCGDLMAYKNGLLFPRNSGAKNVVHKLCAEWYAFLFFCLLVRFYVFFRAPKVYFIGDENENKLQNLESEIFRARKLKCKSCKRKGAALGCYWNSCRKSFHYHCAKADSNFKFDTTRFLVLCPVHATGSFSGKRRKSSSETKQKTSRPRGGKANKAEAQNCPRKYVFCGSSLDTRDKEQLAKFASATGSLVESSWNHNVTHVLAGPDATGGARRTLKLLRGILEGKWILQPEWLTACLSAGHFVDEAPYEARVDVQGRLEEGPKQGRLLANSEAPKLFTLLDFYFTEFEGSLKTDLETLVRAGGGTVLHRQPVSPLPKTTLVIYPQDGKTQRKAAASISEATGAVALEHTWILNSIAGYRLQPLRDQPNWEEKEKL
ncbi:protein BREAST CANCER SUSCEPTIBILITY 1 homolog isoform X1 [Selaginella moellendorffii]|uniref:protein BREAST CANCER SUSCEPTIBILITY 1 homolog isoform X1 n=1 Tax=Selaginella moellendorffii TaxID=88036 RepID=UPI000D1CCEAF|nr:protein BREAST CANCER SUSCEPTIBILITY 1 homolog isoform X1 [Selaginella moellendorffii]|eukprot:XP_024515375.1 protein BREAST CANCER SUSCEPTIBILITY 1 homolog isoform X1 [Selaginella moellendorffii]